ncbi:hypothetical protein B0H14DRAFT_3171843 [Mycena olivaceomarginata]|nr:hypothetical protein B0H14DRAFT_3171843 [Mycena olivaceomarginata]
MSDSRPAPNYFVEYLLKAVRPVRAPHSVLLEFMHMLNDTLAQYDYMNILAAQWRACTRINPTTLDAYDNALSCSSTGVQTDADRAPLRSLLRPPRCWRLAITTHCSSQDTRSAGLRARPQSPTWRRCCGLRKSIFCRFMDDGVVAGLHKFNKAGVPDALQRVREGGCRGDGDRAQEGVGCRVFELPGLGEVEGFAVELLVLESMIRASNAYT